MILWHCAFSWHYLSSDPKKQIQNKPRIQVCLNNKANKFDQILVVAFLKRGKRKTFDKEKKKKKPLQVTCSSKIETFSLKAGTVGNIFSTEQS